ncbi:hypothetical protein GCM10020258_52340 [Sphingomonas yabuuchiae]
MKAFTKGDRLTMGEHARSLHPSKHVRCFNPGQGVMNDQLSAIEWSVVALARGDRLSSLQAPGKFRAFLRRFLEGDRPSPAFADKRLEALRRVSVHAWHRGSPSRKLNSTDF